MAKKKRYNYIKKKIARGTWPCILTMLLALGLLLATLALSVHFQGQGPMLLGALGFSSIVMSIFSIYFLILALHDSEKNYLPVRIGGILATCVLLVWIIFLALGLKAMA